MAGKPWVSIRHVRKIAQPRSSRSTIRLRRALSTKTAPDVAGVAPDKIDPKITIPVCEAAGAAPSDPRIMIQLGRGYGAAKAPHCHRAGQHAARRAAHGYAGLLFLVVGKQAIRLLDRFIQRGAMKRP
jgi:hypothetical protein